MHLIVVDMGVPSHIIHQKYGPFSKWFERAYNNIDSTIMVDGFPVDDVDVEDLLECDGVILSGAEENVGDDLPWRQGFTEKLKMLVDHGQPVLGVCFSHQFISDFFGGTVERTESLMQFGNFVHEKTETGEDDPLLVDVPADAFFIHSHYERVTYAPQRSRTLLKSKDHPHQCLRHTDSVWTVQFHPEMTPGIVMSIIDELEMDEKERERLKFEAQNAHDGLRILLNFAQICRDSARDRDAHIV